MELRRSGRPIVTATLRLVEVHLHSMAITQPEWSTCDPVTICQAHRCKLCAPGFAMRGLMKSKREECGMSFTRRFRWDQTLIQRTSSTKTECRYGQAADSIVYSRITRSLVSMRSDDTVLQLRFS